MCKEKCPPFFIVGCGRSGTSLLRSILNSHKDIAIPLESLFITDYLKNNRRKKNSDLLHLLIKEPEIGEWGISVDDNDFNFCENITDAIRICHQKYAKIKGKKYWGQKTPRFVRNLDLLNKHFPDARFIHLIRDPRAVAESLIRSNVHRSNAYFAAKRWNMDLKKGLEFEKKYPEKIIRVYYEELVSNRDSVLSQILDFLNLPFSNDFIKYGFTGSDEYSAFYKNIHTNLDSNLSTDFISLWKKNLSIEEINIIESINHELMEVLHYKRITNADAISNLKILSMKFSRFYGILKQSYRYIRYRPQYFFYVLWRKWQLGLLRDFFLGINY